jgi:dTDP-glucose 4,6-dehydratase
MGKKIVILGSNSFSGASFVSFLIKRKGVEKVIGISRSNEPNDVFLPYKKDIKNKEKFSFYKIDLNCEIDQAVDLISEFKPEYIVNFAAQGMVSQSWENPDQWIRTNVLSLAELLKEIHKIDSIKGFIQASTPEVYGESNNIVESHCFSPSTPYAASKASADLLLYSYYKTHKFPVKYTRSANIYGPSQQLYRIIPKTILSIIGSTKIQLHGGGCSIRSFVHINDVSKATYLIMNSGRCGDAYHISSNDYISIRELVNSICTLMNVDMNDVVNDTDNRIGNDSEYFMNSNKIYDELGWVPSVSFSDGLKQSIRWIEENYNTMKSMSMNYAHKK